jgi:uncharacterized lipoprotein YajG
MEDKHMVKTNKNYLRIVFVWMILAAFLLTGCPKKQTTPSPA